jgi:hypothetical protein
MSGFSMISVIIPMYWLFPLINPGMLISYYFADFLKFKKKFK